MVTFDTFLFALELLSTTSFGISGAMVGIRRRLDIFGVLILGITTAIGGGMIRDLVLGIHPPKSFNQPLYAIIAGSCALLTFFLEYRYARRNTRPSARRERITDFIMFWLDTIGLACFTVIGVATAYEVSDTYNAFLLCFVGTITGVGGGLLRDVMVHRMPYIFVKHVYACACILGSIVCVSLWKITGRVPAMMTAMAVIILLRFFAAHFRWNLPRVPVQEMYSDWE